MKPYICPQCGGKINRVKMFCEYCGTMFREEHNGLSVVAYHPRVHTLGANVTIAKELAVRSPKEVSEYAIRKLAQEFADGIAQFMEVRTEPAPTTDEIVFWAKPRVLDSEYRFKQEERR